MKLLSTIAGFLSLSLVPVIYAEPAQFCNFLSGTIIPSTNDFCMAVSTYHNQSTKAHDLYIQLDVYRPQNDTVGWTAIGIGSGMAQSVDFVVYGDPRDQEVNPTFSTRRSVGHWLPLALGKQSKIQTTLLKSKWDISLITVARVSFICYSCDVGIDPDLDPLLSATTSSQPWIWAKNYKQRILEYSENSELEMHSLKVGWGSFHVDMGQTVIEKHPPSIPAIRPEVGTIGASETEYQSISYEKEGISLLPISTASLHGFFMGLATLLLIPCGIFTILSGATRAFRHHWIIQIAAIVCFGIGLAFGLRLGIYINTTHQRLGLINLAAIVVQAVLGWRHHIQFRRNVQPSWMSKVHIYLGWAILLNGYSSAVTGLMLHRATTMQYLIVGTIILSTSGVLIGVKLQKHFRLSGDDGNCDVEQRETYQLLKG